MENLYRCIHQVCVKEGWAEGFDVTVLRDATVRLNFRLRRQSENGIVLELYILQPRKLLWEMEIHDILNCNAESIENKLLPMLSYLFLGLFINFPKKFDLSRIDMDEWRNLGIVGSKFREAFDNLLFSMCSFFYTSHKGFREDEIYVNRNGKFPKLLAQTQEEILLSIEAAGAQRLMKFLASIRPLNDERALTISYSPSVRGFWRIASYSPLASLEKTRKSRIWKLDPTKRFQLLNCILEFGHIVNVGPYFIEVCLQMDNVRCDLLPLNPNYSKARFSGAVPNEGHFPAKICLTISPSTECGVQSISLSVSSPNPIKDISKEATIQKPNTLGVKGSVSTTSTEKIEPWWCFEQSVCATTVHMDWTLYDLTTGKPVYNSGPPKASFLRHKTTSIDRAFTEQGGVVFAKDDYGKPITWRLKRDLEGQTLKWIVQASMWLTYKPNTRYSETLRHDFREVVDLKLETTSTHN